MAQCQNVKSRKHPHIQCTYTTVDGKLYCQRHIKNPNPFKNIKLDITRAFTRRERVAGEKIVKRWRKYIVRHRFRQQGSIANCISLANNDTELFTLESVTTIPPVYRFTYRDDRAIFWIFDIRTIQQYMGKGEVLKNPYTREVFPEATMMAIRSRIAYLISKKWPIVHSDTKGLTPEQVWNQHVLDIFLKIEDLGYLVNCDWFHNLTMAKHRDFYRKLYTLWNRSLHLTQKQRDAVIPGNRQKETNPFLINPDESMPALAAKPLKWWRKKNIHIIQLFVTKAKEKENRSLGALYCLMALVSISGDAASAFPWLADAVPN
jgi:hypothetical protein